MLKLLKISCIWICLISSLFGQFHFSTAGTVSLDYVDDHDQLSYDLDTQQSKAKYDTRLLSEQMRKDQKVVKSSEEDMDKHIGSNEELNQSDDMEPHERAASCHSGGRKYTHGQKVPRLDPCEVCLCMDGEIFCWWEICAKQAQKSTTPSYVSTVEYTTYSKKEYKPTKSNANTTKKQHKKLIANENDKIHHKAKQQHKKSNKMLHIAKKLKKKLHQQQQQQKYNEHECFIEEQQQKHQQPHALQYQQHQQKQQLQQQQQHKQEQHSHATSKILNFPENLPSVLYYDYKTEEHQHHQHQHHQQHLKHQQEQQQIRYQQMHQQQQRQQPQQEYEEHINNYDVTTLSPAYQSTKNDNAFAEMETDSDILPEPPTKKPKMTATATTTTTKMTTQTTSIKSNFNVYRPNESINRNNNDDVDYLKDEHRSSRKSFSEDANMSETVKRVDADLFNNENNYEKKSNDNTEAHNNNNDNYNNNKSHEEQDDAFHRWLTSTEKNKKPGKQISDADVNSNYDNDETTVFDLTDTSDNNNLNEKDISANRKTYETAEMPQTKNAENGFFRSSFNDYSSEFNGSVVNIDILLTAADDPQHSQTMQKQKDEQQQQLVLPNDEEVQKESIIVEADLISNPTSAKTLPTIPNTIQATVVSNNNSKHLPTMPTVFSAMATVIATTENIADFANKLNSVTVTTTSNLTTTTTLSPDRKCNVMGTLYKIGDVLPQDTGNCLQCICTDGSTDDDTPRVTCSPHNCPPLVLPDLFDATGY
ncbi:putative mediator of RNA polymerase II transcription subunit 26 [Teleopsis dalmanni]|uniref:putative mediator of RNA polymerase II transcription subunit 26 n=1 Tax=Teleopsis dalmanni TaxID=139649 RepID=UPI0018CF64BF|nr:putative mediator of RNA polymerase II transcription subunit 26 [Teleopsis dalmanni]